MDSIGDELLKLGISPGTRILVVSNNDVATPYSGSILKSLDSYQSPLTILGLVKASVNPPISPIFINTAFDSKGKK